MRFAAVLWRFWAAHGHLREGRRWLEAILALAAPGGAVPPLRWAMLLHVTGNLARAQGDYARAQTLYEECLAIRRAHDDRPGIAGALHNLGIVAHERGDYDRAIRLHEEVLPLARAGGDPYALAFIHTTFGEAVHAAGDAERAVALYEEGLRQFRRIGHAWGIALALTRLGDAALRRGDPARAAALHRESLALSGGLSDARSAADALDGLARAERGVDPALAARLFGAADAQRERLDVPRPPAGEGAHQRTVAATQAALGDAAFAVAWAAGAALTLDQALDTALQAPA